MPDDPSTTDPAAESTGDIYERIWDLCASHVSVSRRGDDGEWLDPDAVVRVDEQNEAGGCGSEAAAPRPLIDPLADESLFDEPTFRAFIDLLDNYTAHEGEAERGLDDPEHRAEVDAFLDAVVATEPMALALDYLETEVVPGTSRDEILDRIRRAWFEPYTNFFSGADPFCVGFEHVFVGEDESHPDHPPGHCRDSVGGFHSWVHYYREQQAGRAHYLTHDYRGNPEPGLAEPTVATVIMTWRPRVELGGNGHELLKKPGGFFVATRPECEMALGSVGIFEVGAGRFQNTNQENHRRVTFGDSVYDLVLHPETDSNRQRGERIRTFYPKFRGAADQVGDGGSGGQGGGGGGQGGEATPECPVPTQPHNDSPIRIARALPNPEGPGDADEWVEIENVGIHDLVLDGWRLTDHRCRPRPLDGTLAAGETRRIATRTDSPDSMAMTNSGGWVLLFEGDQRRAGVRYGKAGQGVVFTF